MTKRESVPFIDKEAPLITHFSDVGLGTEYVDCAWWHVIYM